MVLKIAMSLIFAAFWNVLLVYLFRREHLSRRSLRFALIAANILSIYIAQLIMGVDYRNWFAVFMAVIGGLSLGIQGASVIIRISQLETEAAKKVKS